MPTLQAQLSEAQAAAAAAHKEVKELRAQAFRLEAVMTENRTATDHAIETAARAVKELEEARMEHVNATRASRVETLEAVERIEIETQMLWKVCAFLQGCVHGIRGILYSNLTLWCRCVELPTV